MCYPNRTFNVLPTEDVPEIDSFRVLRHTYWQSRIATATRGDFVTDHQFHK
jgi:hypothetical protein